jgi:hypothetical protein
VVYNVSLGNDTAYWITLQSRGNTTDLNISISSGEMDFEHFMNLAYREDFLYALEYSIQAGLEEGDESFTLSSEFSGPVFVVVHDSGGGGGEFTLKIQYGECSPDMNTRYSISTAP